MLVLPHLTLCSCTEVGEIQVVVTSKVKNPLIRTKSFKIPTVVVCPPLLLLRKMAAYEAQTTRRRWQRSQSTYFDPIDSFTPHPADACTGSDRNKTFHRSSALSQPPSDSTRP
jgi:hypothetical protein